MRRKLAYWLMYGITIPFLSSAQSYPAHNITLLGHWDTVLTVPEPVYGIRYNSIWGWVHPNNNREYAIIGATNGTYIIEVTIPTQPVLRAYIPGIRDSCIWREYKTYNNYLYAVSDDGVNQFNQNGMQIIDLNPLPAGVNVVHSGNSIVERSHTLFIDGDKLYLNSVKGPSVGGNARMAVYSLSNPTSPTLLRKIEDDYPTLHGAVHDAFVRNDTVYASAGYDGLFIYTFNPSVPQFTLIGSLTNYPNAGYNHSSSLTSNGKTLVMCDEVPDALPVRILDVSNMGNISISASFYSNPGATPHNPYVKGNNWVVIAYYQDGVYIYDITNPSAPIMTGFFDTHPQNGNNNGYPSPAYQGCWGAYIDLPSGIILASDMQNGLFILDATMAMSTSNYLNNSLQVMILPNPFHDYTILQVLPATAFTNKNLTLRLFDISGTEINAIITPYKERFVIYRNNVKSGIYFYELTNGRVFLARGKIIIQ